MTGAETLVKTMLNGGVNVCFTNPGTSEMHFVAETQKAPDMRMILCLFEGVCTGAADGYARMAEKPASTLLHLGPGLGNGLANLHNARRAGSPMVNIIGDHATYHAKYDPPLATDIESIARSVSDWVRTSRDAADVPKDGAEAIAAAMTPPGKIATLILPSDCAWNESTAPAPVPNAPAPEPVDPKTIADIASILHRTEPTVMLIASPFLTEKGLALASRIARKAKIRVILNRANSRAQQGAGRVSFDRLPFPVEPALQMLKGTAHLILVGARPPVSFFAWRNLPNRLTPESCRIYTLATTRDDGIAALEALAETVDAPETPADVCDLHRPDLPTGKITAEKVWQAVTALMPDHAVVSDEGITSSRSVHEWIEGAPPHDWLNITGGAIGQGMPVATGAAVACPERKVFSMQADGSGMYTLQSLWTQAREHLNVVTVIFSNHSYKILEGELERIEGQGISPSAKEILQLTRPALNWSKLAEGMGVSGSRAETAEQFNQQLETAVHSPGPHLIEVLL